jgi:hypothetical protein
MSEQYFDLNYIIEYISQNILGLFLLILAFFIIYFVDHINQLNSTLLVLSNTTSNIGIPNSLPIKTTNIVKKKNRSHKIRPH